MATPALPVLLGLLLAAGPSPPSEPHTAPDPAVATAEGPPTATWEFALRPPTLPGPPPGFVAVLDTIRVVAVPPRRPPGPAPRSQPPDAPDAMRDPRDEPLFVIYARPVQLPGFSDRLDLDRVRWRYGGSAPDR